jgi:hypothetical protein
VFLRNVVDFHLTARRCTPEDRALTVVSWNIPVKMLNRTLYTAGFFL